MSITRQAPSEAESSEQIMAAAESWFRRQAEVSRMALGASWPEHKTWITDYLREEIRLRLIARGWRARQ